jgi:hypothetical protein
MAPPRLAEDTRAASDFALRVIETQNAKNGAALRN